MPLHPERKARRVGDPDRLDGAILGHALNHDAPARFENALTVQRVDADGLAKQLSLIRSPDALKLCEICRLADPAHAPEHSTTRPGVVHRPAPHAQVAKVAGKRRRAACFSRFRECGSRWLSRTSVKWSATNYPAARDRL
jgi:hypothetical protein